jgi:hypothetical protein
MADSSAFRFVPRVGGALYQGRAQRNSPLDLSVAFVPPPDTPVAELTLADSWGIPAGVYLFLATPVRNLAAFVAGLRSLLATRTWAGARLLWIADPNLAVRAWNPVGISLVDVGPSGGTLSTLTPFPFRNYGCVLDGGLPLRIDTDLAQFTVTPGGERELRLTTDSGATELPVILGPLTIPLAGQAAGCLCFRARLPVGADGTSAVDALDVGCRFFFDDPAVPEAGLLTSRRFALFDISTPARSADAAEVVDLAAQLDPLAPLDPARSRFAFTDSVALRSFYRTNLGSALDLRPLDAHLRFATRPAGLEPVDADPLYLVPHGAFLLHPPAHETAPALLCGVGGAEYVELPAASTLTFVAGSPAYAPNFDPTATTRLAWPGPRLTGPASTAWASLTADAPLGYFAQPEGAALYGPGTAPPSLLSFFDVRAATLPATVDPAAADVYPLVPHAGATEDLVSYERLEVQVLSQARRQAIHELPVAPPPPQMFLAIGEPADTARTAATPQGLLATFSADKSLWTSLLIAQSVRESPPPAVTRRFALQNVTDPLKAALLTNQQFVVVSDAGAFQAYVGVDNELVIADYRFLVDPATWAQRGTVLIIKNARKPLVELIADPNTWVLGRQFNRDVTATQRQLQAIVNDAEAAAGTDPEFGPFVALLADPAWNGVLLLNVAVPMDGLPPELAGLAAGIDARRFQAHHVGINQTPVPADLTPRNSSLFGLISYDDRRALAATGFDFTVRSLKVRFANSVVATFRSRIALALNELFATPVVQNGAVDNVVELDGVFQKHGDSGTYVFSVTGPTTFAAQDTVLATVGITKATFATVTAPAAGAPDDAVDTVFSFWGTLGFRALATGTAPVPLDLFSYDSLAYGGLAVRMSFSRATPTARTFAFDPGAVTFDVSASTARPTGFAKHFPLTAKGMLAAGTAATPADLGVLPVDTDLETTPVTTPWFALLYDLNLGSVGALAGKAGLVVSFVVAWSPGTTGLAVSVGLKLPGSTGAQNAITVEGVLKITMFAVQLIYDGRAFLLKLTGIALSLFGKTLPPGATFDLFVFGDPDPAAGADSLGWYGAFQKDQPPAITR